MTGERLFADTNLFLRFLTNDIPEQAASFERLLRSAASGECHLVTSVLVIAEIVWTLESYYKLSKNDVSSKVLAILNTRGLDVAERDTLVQATLWYVDKNVDFIDAYNAAWMMIQGIHTVATFDRKHFARFEGIDVRIPS